MHLSNNPLAKLCLHGAMECGVAKYESPIMTPVYNHLPLFLQSTYAPAGGLALGILNEGTYCITTRDVQLADLN